MMVVVARLLGRKRESLKLKVKNRVKLEGTTHGIQSLLYKAAAAAAGSVGNVIVNLETALSCGSISLRAQDAAVLKCCCRRCGAGGNELPGRILLFIVSLLRSPLSAERSLKFKGL